MAKEVETNKEGLKVIVDRYGIGAYYSGAKAILVNTPDAEKAEELLKEAGIVNRIIEPYDLAGEVIISEALGRLSYGNIEKEEDQIAFPVLEREKCKNEILQNIQDLVEFNDDLLGAAVKYIDKNIDTYKNNK